jgi:hypothetical protein
MQSISDVDRHRRMRFVEEYLVDLDEAAAAKRANLPEAIGARLLSSRAIRADIALAQRARMSRTQVYADEVLNQLWAMANVDARELIELRRVNCRFCRGHDHRYQFTPEELRRATAEHLAGQMKLPERLRVPVDDQGGDGYDGTLAPVEDCPECWGEGVASVYIHDTATLSPSATKLYNGVKVSKDGAVELLMRDRNWALDRVMDHLGMKVQKHQHQILTPAQMTDDQLDAALAAFGVVIEHEAQLVEQSAEEPDGESNDEDELDP